MILETNLRWFGKVARAPLRAIEIVIAAMMFLATLAGMPAMAIEHPGVVPKDANCSSCHTKKVSGKSVHSAMVISCTVCHLAMTQGDMTTVSLVLPKEQICFECHERSSALQQHSPAARGPCLQCHDAHSSDRRMLLRAADGPPLSVLKPN